VEQPVEAIPEEYWRYVKLFNEKLETGLSKHSKWDHEIILMPGKELKFYRIYPLNEI
jgi:hypothetical protein